MPDPGWVGEPPLCAMGKVAAGVAAQQPAAPRPCRAAAFGHAHPQHGGLVLKGHDLGAHDGRAAVERHHVAHNGAALALHRHQAGDLDDRVLLRLWEAALRSPLTPSAARLPGQIGSTAARLQLWPAPKQARQCHGDMGLGQPCGQRTRCPRSGCAGAPAQPTRLHARVAEGVWRCWVKAQQVPAAGGAPAGQVRQSAWWRVCPAAHAPSGAWVMMRE